VLNTRALLHGNEAVRRIVEGWGLDSSGFRYGRVRGSCKCGNEPVDYIEGGEFE
jgi:hypothetical protein